MSNNNSNRRNDSGKALLGMLEGVTAFGMQIGGILFVLAIAYLLWGILSGTITNMSGLGQQESQRIWQNVQYACMALTIAGLTVTISAAIRFYDEEVLGYLLLIGGALFYWGAPMSAGISLNSSKILVAKTSPIGYVVGQFQFIGMVALGLAVPYIVLDFWYRMRGVRTTRVTTAPKSDQQRKESTVHLFCWQMPYCRDHLRKHCKAYDQRKSCWHLKSGCYCDEELINMATKGKPGAVEGFDQRYSQSAGQPKLMNAEQKRERCRQCFLYSEHQKMKYKLISPLAFPLTIGFVWFYRERLMAFFTKGLQFADFLASRFSFTHSAQQGTTSAWAKAPSSSETVIWVFMICLSLIVATFILRALEYLIYEKQL